MPAVPLMIGAANLLPPAACMHASRYIEKLEMIMRLLDNDEVTAAEVDDIKDDLDYFVTENQVLSWSLLPYRLFLLAVPSPIQASHPCPSAQYSIVRPAPSLSPLVSPTPPMCSFRPPAHYLPPLPICTPSGCLSLDPPLGHHQDEDFAENE